MAVNSAQELFEHELEDIYYAEHELLDVLQQLADQTEHEEIAQAFEEHREETKGQIERVEQVFEMIGEPPEEEECEGIQGLIEEHQELVDMDPDKNVLDVHNLTAAQKTEHYEIAAYGNLALLADRLGMDEAGDLLHQNLEEEEEALEKLKDLTDQYDYEPIVAA
ncbi:YciE/YciF ferroxidase family protein [Halosimplex sp. J119]